MKKGFTLLELLVAIAIIGVLATIVMASLGGSRAKGRDASRKQTLVNVRSALEIYYARNGAYPSTGGTAYTSDTAGDPGYSYSATWIPNLVSSGLISRLPRDPLGGFSDNPVCTGGWHRAYVYVSTNGTGYKLFAHCSPEGTMLSTDTFYDSIRPTWAWQVCAGSDCSL